MPKHKLTPYQVQWAMDQIAAGHPMTQIAKILGVKANNLSYHWHRQYPDAPLLPRRRRISRITAPHDPAQLAYIAGWIDARRWLSKDAHGRCRLMLTGPRHRASLQYIAGLLGLMLGTYRGQPAITIYNQEDLAALFAALKPALREHHEMHSRSSGPACGREDTVRIVQDDPANQGICLPSELEEP